MGFWSQLNTKKVGSGSDAAAINSQSKDIHLQETNKADLADVILVNKATMRSSGTPIPGTMQVFSLEMTSTSRAVIIAPNKGEVWQLISASSTASGAPSDSVTYYLYYQTEDQSGDDQVVYAGSSASGSTEAGLEDLFELKTAQYVDENTQAQIGLSNMRGVTTFTIKILAVRIR